MGFATKWKTKKLCAKEWSKRHIFLSHFFIFHHKPKRMLKCLRNGFWIVIVQKIQKKCLSHSGKMHFSVSGHVTLGVVRWRHELDYICPLWVLSKFGLIEAYMCRVIVSWFFPSNGIKRYFNGPLRSRGGKCRQKIMLFRFLLKLMYSDQLPTSHARSPVDANLNEVQFFWPLKTFEASLYLRWWKQSHVV